MRDHVHLPNSSFMIPVCLTRIKTRDGVVLNGIVVEPERKSDKTLIWIHGLTSNFYSGHARVRELAETCRENRIGFFSFNTRGHDIVARTSNKRSARRPRRKAFAGAAFERFADSIEDIRSVIRFARKLGYRNAILAGHSTGANKALYYAYKTKDPAVKGLALIAPISDVAAAAKDIGEAELRKRVRVAERLQKTGAALMPAEIGIFSPKRYLSLFRPGEAEDVFPYHDPKARWKELASVRVPIAVIIGKKDEHLDRPASQLIEIFRARARSTKSFTESIIPGANHGFKRKEEELSEAIVHWINGL